MTTGKRNKTVLTLAAVAIVALAIGQAQAEMIDVPNGSFELIYKPGETTITADLAGGTWTNGVGPDTLMEAGQTVSYSDGTSGTAVDIPGWINAPDWPIAYEWDKGCGTVSKQGTQPEGGGDYTFGANGINWGVPDSGAVESDAPLVYNIDGTYRISMLVNGPIKPVAFDLLAGDVVITPSSSVTPPAPHAWDKVSRTYDVASLTPHLGEPLRIRAGWGPGTINDGTQSQSHLDLVTLEAFNRLYPFPEYDDTFYTGDMELSWTNLPGNYGDANDVYVDVWFGTDPNDATGVNYTRIVTAEVDGLNATSATVDLTGDPATYYWQINSYLNGPDLIDDANMIESFVWRFHTTNDMAPESVDAGINMITWSGQEVQLDATVVDDAASPLTYLWTADDDSLADPNLTIEIISADQEDPTVTITKTVPTGDAVTVTLTLAVHDDYNTDPLEDTLVIDVYDDPCEAAIFGMSLDADNPVDLNKDCVINLEDVAIVAEKWLLDNSSTEPVAK
jgi:hypothetical protein